MSSPLKRPPSHLKDRVLAAAGIRRPGPLRRVAGYARAAAGIAAVFVAVAAFTGMVWMRGEMSSLRDDDERLQRKIDEALSQEVEIAALTRKLDDQEKEAARLADAATGDQDLIVALLSNNTRIADVVPAAEDSTSIGRLVWAGDQKVPLPPIRTALPATRQSSPKASPATTPRWSPSNAPGAVQSARARPSSWSTISRA